MMVELIMLDTKEIKSAVDGVICDIVLASGAARESSGKSFFIEPQMRLAEDFGLDSLDIVELVSALENKFNIEMSDDVFDAVDTVADLYKHMSATLAKKG